MEKEVLIIGSQTLGTPTEMYEALYGDNIKVALIEGESKSVTFKIENTYVDPDFFIKPLTRKERRKLKRKKK